MIKDIMRKFFILTSLIFSILVFLGCSQYIMYNSVHGTYSKHQLDSICNVEQIPSDFGKWIPNTLVDFETQDTIYQYIYIKQLKGKDRDEIMYNVLKSGSQYKFNKRVVEKNK